MTPDTAPEAITQAEAWSVNPDTPSTIITPHGRISIGWTVMETLAGSCARRYMPSSSDTLAPSEWPAAITL